MRNHRPRSPGYSLVCWLFITWWERDSNENIPLLYLKLNYVSHSIVWLVYHLQGRSVIEILAMADLTKQCIEILRLECKSTCDITYVSSINHFLILFALSVFLNRTFLNPDPKLFNFLTWLSIKWRHIGFSVNSSTSKIKGIKIKIWKNKLFYFLIARWHHTLTKLLFKMIMVGLAFPLL